ncbi:MAG: TraB/GumN family protein [Bacteroidota bacterium]|jgi:uncharacterized protein YbaP (TraB family)
MNRPLLTLIILSLLTGLMSAPSAARPLDAAGRQSSLLWRVVSPAGAVSHVFGTIHIADTLVFRQRDTVLQILDSSRTYASELNLDSVMNQLSPKALMLESGTLYDLFDSASVEAVCQRLGRVNTMFATACPRLKPGAIMMIVAMGEVQRTAPTSIDEFLWARAKKQRLQRTGLETIAEQLSIIDSMPAGYVLEQLTDTAQMSGQLDRMRRLYAQEDLDGLESYAAEHGGMDDATMQMVNDNRNIRMVGRMEAMLRQGGAFIAIGALHLTGRASVLDLLSSRGYHVEPVTGGRRTSWLAPAQRE